MNKKTAELMRQFALEEGLSFQEKSSAIFGEKQGYSVCILFTGNAFSLEFSLRQGTAQPQKRDMKEIVSAHKSIRRFQITMNKVSFLTNMGMTLKKGIGNLHQALEDVLAELKARGYENCCQNCSKAVQTGAYYAGGSIRLLCTDCSQQVSQALSSGQQTEQKKRENLIGGIVGALLGSLLGAVCIILISQLGYVAVLSGIVMGVCTVKGYELLGGKLSMKGIVISALIMIGMVYFAHQVDWAITIASYFDVNFMIAFRSIGTCLSEGILENYYGNLVLSYLFTVLGAGPTLWAAWQNKNEKFEAYELQQDDYAAV